MGERKTTDAFMKQLRHHFIADMCTSLELEIGSSPAISRFLSDNMDEFRKAKLTLHDNLSPYAFKWFAQFNGLYKRYVFQDDVLTPAMREEATNVKFINLQERLAKTYWKPRTYRLHKVISQARRHAIRILRGFTPTEVHKQARFGTKSTIGCPLANAYIDVKLLEAPITGSTVQLEWFKDHCESDQLLKAIIAQNPEGYREIDLLQQVNVPKKFSIDRGINPNTLVGSYYTASLGKIVEDALEAEGLPIRRLQQRHRVLARRASTKGKLATADLSDASHGFLSNLINALLPRKWYRALMHGVIRQVEVGGRRLRLESIMTMGIGFTFPVQTLLFYCLLLALSDLTGIRGVISVYGDDLIYPRKLHPFVVGIFGDLGFKLNLDKTFVQSPFKESCGEDFFRGVAVRPYSPEGVNEALGKVRYAAFCYKVLNGLLVRWTHYELSNCVQFILQEIVDSMGEVYLVPAHMPDYSGYRVTNIAHVTWDELPPVAKAFPISTLCSSVASPPRDANAPWFQDIEFKMIRAVPRSRFVKSMLPYYWDWLRSSQSREGLRDLSDSTLPRLAPGVPLFKWKRKKRYNNKGQSRKDTTVRLYATVPTKDGTARYLTVFATSSQSVSEETFPE